MTSRLLRTAPPPSRANALAPIRAATGNHFTAPHCAQRSSVDAVLPKQGMISSHGSLLPRGERSPRICSSSGKAASDCHGPCRALPHYEVGGQFDPPFELRVLDALE